MGDTRKTSETTADPGAPVILGNLPGSFARGVLDRRHPALIKQVREAFPYGPRQHRALDALLEEITHGVIEPLDATSADHGLWAAWGREYFGKPWFDAPFLWSESYFYRRLLAAIEYFDEGPWQGVDPFAPFKQAELRGATVDEELRSLDELADVPDDVRATALLRASLWGNRADLGFRVTEAEPAAPGNATPGSPDPGLVSDDSALLRSLLPAGNPAGVGEVSGAPEAGAHGDAGASRAAEVTGASEVTVALVADNAGRELIPDLVLLDHLLDRGHAERAVLHVKPYPYYVSDATTADVIDSLRRLVHAPGEAGTIGRRLWAAMGTGCLEVRAHSFFCAPFPYEEMPQALRKDLGAATLTILKGDLNYRRLVGDRLWDPTTPFVDVTAYFPGPVAALRTLKSDVVVGLRPHTLSMLEASGDEWRTSGTHAMIQARP